MREKYGDDLTQHPELDPEAWLTAAGQPKKGRVPGFGSGLDPSPMLSPSSQCSYSPTATFTTPASHRNEATSSRPVTQEDIEESVRRVVVGLFPQMFQYMQQMQHGMPPTTTTPPPPPEPQQQVSHMYIYFHFI